MKENKTKPDIRLKGFIDDWEQRKLGEVLETVTDYVAAGSFADLAKNVEYKDFPDYAQLVRTMDLKNGFTSIQEVYVNKSAFDYLYRVNMDKECIILPNIGNCGEVYYVKPEYLPYEHNVLGPNAIFVRSETNANKFLSILFQAKDFQTKLKLIVSPNGQTKFNKTELKRIDLILPANISEQQKIGDYFQSIDHLITLHQRECDQLKELKKTMLKKMFPRDGSNIPEVRFAGFTDDWEQRKLGEIAKYRNGKAHENNISKDGKYVVVNSKFVSTGGQVKKYSDEQIEPLYKGEIAFVLSDVPNGRAIARTFLVDKSKKYTLNQRIAGITPMEITDSYFLHILMNRNKYFLKFDDGAKQTNLSVRDVMSFEEKYPCYREQQQIGVYFKNLDNLITLHQRELEILKNLKKTCLKRMFI